jgi:hypothetical protein
MQIIADGKEAHAETLEKLQVEAENKLLEAIAKRITHQLPEPVVLRNVRVFDSSTGKLSDRQSSATAKRSFRASSTCMVTRVHGTACCKLPAASPRRAIWATTT